MSIVAKAGHAAGCDSFGWPDAAVAIAFVALLAFVLWLMAR